MCTGDSSHRSRYLVSKTLCLGLAFTETVTAYSFDKSATVSLMSAIPPRLTLSDCNSGEVFGTGAASSNVRDFASNPVWVIACRLPRRLADGLSS